MRLLSWFDCVFAYSHSIFSCWILMIEFIWILLSGTILFLGWMYITRYFKILDKPWKDVPKRDPVPTLQGVTLIASFFALGMLRYPQYMIFSPENPFFWLLLGGLLIAALSFIDELWLIIDKKFRVSAGVRLCGHVVAALIAFYVSGVGITEFQLPGGVLLEFGLFSTLLLTVAWYLMFVNAINRFDGVYGLASWLSSIGFFTIVLLIELVVFTQYPDMLPERAILLTWVSRMWMLLGSLSLIALVMEWKPFGLMRDVGTMFLWFSLAYLALLGWAKIWIMIVVLALPLFDAIWVIIDRLHRRKKHPFKWDYSHLHYRLLALWRNRNEVRVVLLGLSLCMLILMLLLDDDRMAKVIVFALVALVFFGVNGYMYRIKWLEVEYTPKK